MDSAWVEIWGIPKSFTENSFMHTLGKRKLTACMASLRPAGFKDANVFGIGNIRLVTLRNIPVYAFNPVVRQKALYPPKSMIQVLYFGINDPEALFVRNAWFDFALQDTVAIEKKLAFYRQFGENYDRAKLFAKFQSLQYADKVGKDTCLYFMKRSNDIMLKEAALVYYLTQVKNTDEIITLFPLLLDRDLGSMLSTPLTNYFEHGPLEQKYWIQNHFMLVRLLNCPDPFLVTNLMDLYRRNDYCKKYYREILRKGKISMLEILNARRPECAELKDKVILFLQYLSDLNYGKDYGKWIDYLSG